ncbi:hypothetical protein [Fibrivirga algicola]|uniref:Uncharacterized protein n=1 Tax=Fibrivirga algicola TaxID=2950420 RepID=A0ABX0QCX8_9BACT|nr:hypothetical protein [Fibrivirga algicola]ARK13320.1 hypothetical protein A6C57_24935 [Fibrella sp. ES10-3-2-2]NID09075.1 hypothetical protein [Fibrivirga algicola]
MVFLLTAIDEACEIREFTCHLDKLENGLDFLSDLVAQGYILLKARILDENNFTQLPVEAFDGVPFSTALQQIEEEWKTILNEPVSRASVAHQAHIQRVQQKLAQCDKLIASYKLTITRLTALVERAHNLAESRQRGSGFIDHYKSIIDSYDTRLVNAYVIHHQLSQRLRQLGANQ